MKININKDFLQEYKNDLWKGFSGTEIVHIAEGFICVGLVVAGLYFGMNIPIATAIYVAVPVAAPVVFVGFYKYQGYLSVKELISEALFVSKTKRILYESEESKPDKRFCIENEPNFIKGKRTKNNNLRKGA